MDMDYFYGTDEKGNMAYFYGTEGVCIYSLCENNCCIDIQQINWLVLTRDLVGKEGSVLTG